MSLVKKVIYLYSPSGAVRDRAAFKRGVRRLTELGYDVEVDQDALTRFERFAGDDATRIRAVERAANSGADVALITRGGYGITRVIDRLPYTSIASAIENGTQFVGISDFTALQLALFAQTGARTWAGPALCEGFGVGGVSGEIPDDIMEDCFADLLMGQGEGTGWRQDRNGHILETDFVIEDATLWGGNLTVLASLIGTPYFPDIREGILFLEDVAEHPYRIERMLTQLMRSGVLARQRAIVLGQFSAYKLTSHDSGFGLPKVIGWLRNQLNIPVYTNLPYGHVPTKVLLPFGLKVDLTSTGKDVLLYWGHH
ncbi:LD-carboxypeptidase [Rhodoferax sp. TBRC 17198]|uniref:LD-carboxypeptidase n=1 Tax=Rhodoferax potami TaxID=3068338 RepID=UPI0028BEA1A3|nr:LD-carboxypeptidase [Rhodoferax sp. TBRC 17198]MDT7522044.1 LD-carboxypeptidase [Rhodoferax sp. TBRC 17198]